jgi:hypothetical protein
VVFPGVFLQYILTLEAFGTDWANRAIPNDSFRTLTGSIREIVVVLVEPVTVTVLLVTEFRCTEVATTVRVPGMHSDASLGVELVGAVRTLVNRHLDTVSFVV